MTGVELIAKERERQVTEGWYAHHDDTHNKQELAIAATCYARPDESRQMLILSSGSVPLEWPWSARWWKPTPDDRVRELVKAGALIAAEIDRLQRKAEPGKETSR